MWCCRRVIKTSGSSGFTATISGGLHRTAAGDFDWVAGSLFEDK
jgi:hypothetical protein